MSDILCPFSGEPLAVSPETRAIAEDLRQSLSPSMDGGPVMVDLRRPQWLPIRELSHVSGVEPPFSLRAPRRVMSSAIHRLVSDAPEHEAVFMTDEVMTCGPRSAFPPRGHAGRTVTRGARHYRPWVSNRVRRARGRAAVANFHAALTAINRPRP